MRTTLIIKKDIEFAIKTYEDKRSLWKVGLYLYAADYFLSPITKFYYDLRSFLQQDLKELKSEEGLSRSQIGSLRNLVNYGNPGFNSTNSAIVDLHTSITGLLDDYDFNLSREDSYETLKLN